jgi:hypothetical protein
MAIYDVYKPGQSNEAKLRLAPGAQAMLTDGIDLRGARMRLWHERSGSAKLLALNSAPLVSAEFTS